MTTYTITDTITGETCETYGTEDLYPRIRVLFTLDDAEVLHAIERLSKAVSRHDITMT